jgi:hypothetical protein
MRGSAYWSDFHTVMACRENCDCLCTKFESVRDAFSGAVTDAKLEIRGLFCR